jgi:hypothetical protein
MSHKFQLFAQLLSNPPRFPDVLPQVASMLTGDPLAHFANVINGGWAGFRMRSFTHGRSRINKSGVTICGGVNPIRAQMTAKCTRLLGFARCF